MRTALSTSLSCVSIWAVALVGLLPTSSTALSQEKVKPSESTETASAAPAKPEDVSDETIESCKSQLRQLLEGEMEAEISHLAKTAALSDETIEALRSASSSLVEKTLADATQHIRDYVVAISAWIRTNRVGIQVLGAENFSSFFSRRASGTAVMFQRNAGGPPQPQIPALWREKAWQSKVDALLSTEQRKAIADFLADESAKLEKSMKGSDVAIRKRLGIEAAILRSRIERAVELDADRLSRFHALLEQAQDKGTTVTLERLRNFIEDLPRNSRDQWQGNLGGISSFDYDIEADSLWKEGIDSLLSPAEQENVSASMKDRLERLTQALVELSLRELDNRCRLSAEQKAAIRPLVEKAVAQENKDAPNPESKMGPAVLFSGMRNRTRNACDHLPEADLQKILDARQFSAWNTHREKNEMRRASSNRGRNTRNSSTPENPAPPIDPEALIQEHLVKSTESQRAQLRTAMLAKVDEIARDTAVDATHAERLRTAALGAVEFHLKNWKPNFENNLRANLQNVRPEGLAERLGNFGFFMMGGTPLAPQTQPIWKNAYNSELSEPQRQRLTQLAQQRQEELAKMVATLTTWIFERHTALRPTQIPPVRELVAKAILEYLPDLEQTYGAEDSESPWYNHLHSVVLPLFAVGESDLKQILTPAQWERWSKSELHNSFGSNWTNIKSLHESRKVRQKQ